MNSNSLLPKRESLFDEENRERIQIIENRFGPAGKPLYQEPRYLVGEGRLLKQCRRGPQLKVFFLFSDILVYGSEVVRDKLYTRQHFIPLEDIHVKDVVDSPAMKHRFLLQTPQKSFHVGSSSIEEKTAWIEHIRCAQATLLECSDRTLNCTFAKNWIPDQDSSTCMRCSFMFTVTHRRHHCRGCGFLVCGACSKDRAVIKHIHPTKQQRVCTECCLKVRVKEHRLSRDSDGRSSSSRLSQDWDGRSSSDEDKDSSRLSGNSRENSFSYIMLFPSTWVPAINSNRD